MPIYYYVAAASVEGTLKGQSSRGWHPIDCVKGSGIAKMDLQCAAYKETRQEHCWRNPA